MPVPSGDASVDRLVKIAPLGLPDTVRIANHDRELHVVGQPDRAAKGGDNPQLVQVTVTAAEIAAFKKGIA